MKKAQLLLLLCLLSFAALAQYKSTAVFKDLVTTDWKGVVWEPYSRDWASAGTSSDAKEIAGAGIKWARPWVNAADSYERTDAMIAQCKSAKVQIVLCYNKGYPRKTLGTAEQQANEADHLKKFVQRYKKDVHYWEVHNEPNIGDFWKVPSEGKGSTDPNSPYNLAVHQFVQWLQLAYTTIKTEDPKAVVILGGIANWEMEDFMDRLTVEAGYQFFDEVAFHPYAVGGRSYPDECISRLKSFQQKMSKWPAPKNDLPIWITEIGFHTGGITSPGPVGDEGIKAKYLEETMLKLMSNLHYARPIFWYIYHETDASLTYFSLVKKYMDNGSVRTDFLPAYDTYKNMNQSWQAYKRNK